MEAIFGCKDILNVCCLVLADRQLQGRARQVHVSFNFLRPLQLSLVPPHPHPHPKLHYF